MREMDVFKINSGDDDNDDKHLMVIPLHQAKCILIILVIHIETIMITTDLCFLYYQI